MKILTIKTDQPEAEIGLFEDQKQLSYVSWQAHRNLSKDIHIKIDEVLEKANAKYENLEGILFFAGPGSFTGLRIGASVANALANGLKLPIIASASSNWVKTGIDELLSGKNSKMIVPDYGRPPRITQPRK